MRQVSVLPALTFDKKQAPRSPKIDIPRLEYDPEPIVVNESRYQHENRLPKKNPRRAGASRTASVFKSKFQALTIRRGHKRSIVALAHKLLRTMFFMLKRREHYRDSVTDYEALSVQRNAPRWIKTLKKFGFIPDFA